jgi:hypothetical protein
MPNYRLAAERAAKKYGVDPKVFLAMIQQESGFNPNARSGAGAQGIAQFMPGTAKGYGVNLNDGRVTDDLEGAARYIRDNLAKTGGNYHQALSIYNSGRPDAYKDPGFAGGQTYNYVRSILGAAGGERLRGGGGQKGSAGATISSTTTRTIPGVDNSQERRALVAAYLANTHDPSALTALAAGLLGAKDTAAKTVTSTSTSKTGGKTTATGGGYDPGVLGRAKAIDAKHMPYQWGGGHQPNVKPGQPLDCSGAVSRVLGIDARVSGQFTSWGKPGAGGTVTVYANDHHVLMKIKGKDGKYHFFGTSSTNPGGGAGFIPESAISPEYLAGFTARHQ